jgi:hypothetical protein
MLSPVKAQKKRFHERNFNVQVAIDPAFFTCGATIVQLARRYEATRTGGRILELISTVKSATTPIIQADCIEVMHVRRKRMLHPPGTHDFKAFQAETSKIPDEIRGVHFLKGTHWIFIFPAPVTSPMRKGQPLRVRYCELCKLSWIILSRNPLLGQWVILKGTGFSPYKIG